LTIVIPGGRRPDAFFVLYRSLVRYFTTDFEFNSQGRQMHFLPLSLGSLRSCSSRFLFSRFTVALATVALASLPLADRASAASVEWGNPTGGYYDVGSNWVGGAYPTGDLAAIFTLNNSYTVQWDALTATTTPGVSFVRIQDGSVVFQNVQPSAQWDFTVGGLAVFEEKSLTIRGLHLKNNGANAGFSGNLIIDGNSPVGSKMTVYDSQGLKISRGRLFALAGGVVANTTGYLGTSAADFGVATVDGLGSQWNNSARLYVGYQGPGYLFVQAGGVVTNTEGYLGFNPGVSGQAVVTGSGSKWTNSNSLFVGRSGAGSLRVAAGGVVTNAGGYIGLNAGSTGAATVTGSGSQWNTSSDLYVGASGAGTLNVEAGGVVTNAGGYIGSDAASTGAATVTGSGSQWLTAGNLYVGGGVGDPGGTGTGSLTIADGGFVSVAGTTTLSPTGTLNLNGGVLETGSFDNNPYGGLNFNNGKLTVNGVGGVFNPFAVNYRINGNTAAALATLAITNTASFTLSDSLVVGDTNKGHLSVSAGSVVSNTLGYIGLNAGSTGSVTVNGTNSRWNNLAQMLVGFAGNGTLTVEAGGTVSNTEGFVGYNSVSSGAATVTGAGSQWNNSGNLTVALAGSGRLSVANGGMVTVGGVLTVGASGVLVGNGSIVGNVSSGGAVAPGNSAGLLTVTGNYTQTSGGTLYMEIGGTTSGNGYDQLLATGQMALGGTLSVSLLNGFEPQAGNSFNILDWGSIAGTFAALSLPPLPGSLTWNTSQLYTTGVLNVVGPGTSGDYNLNGVVDAADYVVWRKNPGGFPAGAYATWRSQFGQPGGSGAGANAIAAVPEPATLVLLIFAAAGWYFRRGRAS
jgi:T5SS/PEP-CTERM-associated repeat protein